MDIWKSELLKQKTNSNHNTSVFTTLSLSISKLKDIDEEAIELLKVLAFLDGQGIDKGLIIKFSNNDLYQLNKFLSLLEDYSIIEINDANDVSFDEQSIRIHQLTQIFMESECADENQTLEILEKIANVIICDMEYCITKSKIMDGKHWIKHFNHLQESRDVYATNFLLFFKKRSKSFI